MVADNMDQIYVSIHELQSQSSYTQHSWYILIRSTKCVGVFHRSRNPELTIYEPYNGTIEGRRFTKADHSTQVLKVLVGESQSNDLSSRIDTAFSRLSGDASTQHQFQQLQQDHIIRNFDLHIFTTIVEDRLRLIMRDSRREAAEEMNYLSYCKRPAVRSSTGMGGSDYFMSAYEEPAEKTKKGFWLSCVSGQHQKYRSVASRDPYGGLM